MRRLESAHNNKLQAFLTITPPLHVGILVQIWQRNDCCPEMTICTFAQGVTSQDD